MHCCTSRLLTLLISPPLIYISLNRHAPDPWNIWNIWSPSPRQWTSQSVVQTKRPDESLYTDPFTSSAIAPISECHSRVPKPVDLIALFHARLEVTGQKVKTAGLIKGIITWVLASDFLRDQLLEPIVGGLVETPEGVEVFGIKGQSVYTALFDYVDGRTLTCKICGHEAGRLEDAVGHQRDHFVHYPYRCTATHAQW